MASLTKLIFETDGKRLSPVASDADYDIYDGENGSMNISVHLLDGWESMGCVVECQNVNTGKKDMGGTRAGNVLNYTVNASLLTTGKLAFHLRGTDGDTIIKTDDWFVDVYRSFDVADGMEPIEPTQYDQLSGQIGALEGQFGNLLDEIENGEFDGYSSNWSACTAVIPTDSDGLVLSDFSIEVSLVLKRGTTLITGVLPGYGIETQTGYTAPTVTGMDANGSETARWKISYTAGARMYPQAAVMLNAMVLDDSYQASMKIPMAAALQGEQGPQGPQGEQGETGPQGPQGEQGATGEQGPAGADGVSPAVAISDIAGGHRIKITDASGDHVYDVMDATESDSGWIRPSTGMNAFYRSVGNRVSVALNTGSGAYLSGDGAITVFTLPQGYRPSGDRYFVGYSNYNGDVLPVLFHVSASSGAVMVQKAPWSTASVSIHQVQCCEFSFLVN